MKKLFLLIPAISILFLIFFTMKSDVNNIITITHDEKPYKIQPQIIQNKNKKGQFFIYDTLNNKQFTRVTSISKDSEAPMLIQNKNLNNIDKIINNIIDDNQPEEFNGIKIIIHQTNIDSKFNKIDIVNDNGIKTSNYILDLGLFINEKKALDQQEQLIKICPNTKDLYKITIHSSPDKHILYNLKLSFSDYNTAIGVCRNFLKYQENCIITNWVK